MAQNLFKGNRTFNTSNSEKIWSCSGCKFIPKEPDVDDITYRGQLGMDVTANADGIAFYCSVELPDGAVIDSFIVYGNAAAAAESFYLIKQDISSNTISSLGTTNINTEFKTNFLSRENFP